MDSPRSEKVDTRYSTPVPELFDHRLPPSSAADAPLAQTHERQASGHLASPAGGPSHGPIARDFEQASGEEDKHGNAEKPSLTVQTVSPSPLQGRHASRRVTHQVPTSRPSSESSSQRSSSPPDSIDAFAEPRRRERANTVGSRHASEFEEIQRTVSGGTHRRRPTFDDPNLIRNTAVFVDDLQESPEPATTEEPGRIPRIDYEALEEFVAEHQRGRALAQPRKKYSFSTQGGQQNTSGNGNLLSKPRITRSSPSPARRGEADYPASLEKVEARESSERTLAMQPSKVGEDRFTFFSTEIDRAIHAPDLGGLLDSGERFRDMFEFLADDGAWWLDVTNPTKDELEVIEKAFGIHRLTTEVIGEKETREKVELFQTYYFVCFRSYQTDVNHEDYLEPINLYLVVFREGILSFSYAPHPHAARVRQRIGNRKDTDSLTADWICYAMVDHIVDSYFPALRSIEIETEQIEDQVFVARAEDFSPLLRQIGECRKRVVTLMRLLGGKADVIKGFAKRCNAQYTVTPRVEIGLYLSDIQDHVVTMMSNLGHFEKMLSRSHANYLAQLSVDNLVQGNRANEVLGKITFIASVLVPMNLICGVFGMNIPIPGSVNPGPNYAVFGVVIGVMGMFVLLAVIVGRRLRYI